jgi:hypothetical protein
MTTVTQQHPTTPTPAPSPSPTSEQYPCGTVLSRDDANGYTITMCVLGNGVHSDVTNEWADGDPVWTTTGYIDVAAVFAKTGRLLVQMVSLHETDYTYDGMTSKYIIDPNEFKFPTPAGDGTHLASQLSHVGV